MTTFSNRFPSSHFLMSSDYYSRPPRLHRDSCPPVYVSRYMVLIVPRQHVTYATLEHTGQLV